MTEKGKEQVLATTQIVYGPGKLIDPAHLAKIFVSPRVRASQTFEILTSGEGPKEIAEELAEWSYGLYEGLLTKQIREARKERGLDKEKEWDIWRDGCEEGEYVYVCLCSDQSLGLLHPKNQQKNLPFSNPGLRR